MFLTYYYFSLNSSATIVVHTLLILFILFVWFFLEKACWKKNQTKFWNLNWTTQPAGHLSSLCCHHESPGLCPFCLHAESDLPTLIWRFFIISSSICLDLSFFSLLFKELIFTPLRNLPRSSNWILPLIDFVRDKWWSWWVQSPSCWHREAHHLPGSVISLPHSKESGLKEQAHHSSTCSDYCHTNLVSLYDHLPSAL